jgi:voltage-gated potassium channel
MLKSFVTRLAGAIGYFLFILTGGAIGYMAIEGWSLRDALYMTAITISAVGYDEVFPLSPSGRSFTMILIFLGITGIGIYLGLLTSFIVEFDLRTTIKQKRIMKRIEKLNGHIVVCGCGRTGRRVVLDLIEAKRAFVVVEINPDRMELLLEDYPETIWIEGDATHDQTLEAAGLSRASGLVATLSTDSDNVYVCLSARSSNPELTIVARAYEDETIQKLYRAGASHVVSPNITGALRMSSVLLRPSVLSFLDVTIRSRDVSLRLEQATVGQSSSLAGSTLKSARIREETGLMVIAIRKDGPGSDFVFNPIADTSMQVGDELIVLGQPDQIERLKQYAGDVT